MVSSILISCYHIQNSGCEVTFESQKRCILLYCHVLRCVLRYPNLFYHILKKRQIAGWGNPTNKRGPRAGVYLESREYVFMNLIARFPRQVRWGLNTSRGAWVSDLVSFDWPSGSGSAPMVPTCMAPGFSMRSLVLK